MMGYPIRAEDPKDEMIISAPVLGRSNLNRTPASQLITRAAVPDKSMISTGAKFSPDR
jgi:hypothetical protein